jgi:hypothetical protein
MHDLTAYVHGLQPLELVCNHDNPVLATLLSAWLPAAILAIGRMIR